jgi:hypothetical protein
MTMKNSPLDPERIAADTAGRLLERATALDPLMAQHWISFDRPPRKPAFRRLAFPQPLARSQTDRSRSGRAPTNNEADKRFMESLRLGRNAYENALQLTRAVTP